jgi:ABC-type bacteriocin/lantibiotic exporter with double-glycine peptidase domain
MSLDSRDAFLSGSGSLFNRRRTPIVLQTETAECGMACLAMIAGHYGHRWDLPALRKHYDVSLKGMTLHDVVHLAHKLKLSTRALRVEMIHLKELRLPCILHWDHVHFVVLTRIGRRGLTIHDPAVGRRVVPLQEVSRRFTGIVLEAWPSYGFERKAERARVRIFELVRNTDGFLHAAAQIFLMSLFLEVLVIATPLAFQLVLDEVIVVNDQNLLVLVVLGLSLILSFRVVIDFVRSWSIMAAGAMLTLQWKMSLFRHLIRLPLSFFERRHVGDLASRFMSLEMIQKTLTTGAISSLVDGLMSVGLVVMMWLYEPLLAMLAVSVMVLYGISRAIAYRLYRAANEEAIIYAARENTHFIETLRGMPSIKALVIGDRRQAAWNNYLVDHVGAELRIQKLDLLFKTVNTLLFGLDRIVIIYLGARSVLSGTLTVGMLVAFLAYKDQFSSRIATLLDTLVKLMLLGLHSERLADVALAEPEEAVGPYTPVILAEGESAPRGGSERAGHQLSLRPQRAPGHRGFRFRRGAWRVRGDRRAVRRREDHAAQDTGRIAAAQQWHGVAGRDAPRSDRDGALPLTDRLRSARRQAVRRHSRRQHRRVRPGCRSRPCPARGQARGHARRDHAHADGLPDASRGHGQLPVGRADSACRARAGPLSHPSHPAAR